MAKTRGISAMIGMALALLSLHACASGPPRLPSPAEQARGLADQWGLGNDNDRAGLEIRLATLFLRHPAVALAEYRGAADPEHRELVLRVMSLAGRKEFLPAIHEELNRPDGLHASALLAATIFADPGSAIAVRLFLNHPRPVLSSLAISYFQGTPAEISWREVRALLVRREPRVRTALLGLLPRFPHPKAQARCLAALQEKLQEMAQGGAACLTRMAINFPTKFRQEPARRALLRTFRDGTSQARPAMVRALAAIAPGQSRAQLEAWLLDQDQRVALAALVGLQGINSPKTVPRLMKIISTGTSRIPTQILVKSLGLTGDRRAVDFLGRRLIRKGAQSAEQLVLLEAMGDLGYIEGQAYVLPLVNSRDAVIRSKANNALQRIAARQLDAPPGTQSPGN